MDDVVPEINNDGYVVWKRHDKNHSREGGELYLYDGTSVKQLTNNVTSEAYWKMNNTGKIIYAKADDNDHWDLYVL